jgi:hypothetical protein
MLAPGFPAALPRFSSVFDVPNFLRISLVLRSRSKLGNILSLEFGDRDFRPGEKNVSQSSECDVRVDHSAECLFTDYVRHTAAIRLIQQHWNPSTLLFERYQEMSTHT